MKWTEVRTNWKKVEKQFHTKWNKLTNADLQAIGGSKHELVTRLQQRYALDKESAEEEADSFVRTLH